MLHGCTHRAAGRGAGLCYHLTEPLDPLRRGHALSVLLAAALDLGTATHRSRTGLLEHRSPGRPATDGTPPVIGVAAVVAHHATAAALPTSHRPVLATRQLRARPAVRVPLQSSALVRPPDRPPSRSKEDPR
jgi:hypothetical protein